MWSTMQYLLFSLLVASYTALIPILYINP